MSSDEDSPALSGSENGKGLVSLTSPGSKMEEEAFPLLSSTARGTANLTMDTGYTNLTNVTTLDNGDSTGLYRSSPRGQRSLASLSMDLEDVSRLRVENSQLRSQLKQAQMDFHVEQDAVIQLKKRLNNNEKDRLLSTSRSNNEITSLESEVTKLRAQLEKGEATRQNLEFDLARTRRDLNQEKRNCAEKEKSLLDMNNSMKQKISQLTEDITELQQQIRDVERQGNEAEDQLKGELAEKEDQLSRNRAEQEVLRADRDRLELVMQDNANGVSDLNDRLQEVDADRQMQTETLHRTTSELQYARERADQMKKDLELAMHKMKSLEEAVEAERAAHLETKFNSEIIQLRVRDLEGAVEVEKVAQTEANRTTERVGSQVREIQQLYEQERDFSRQARQKLEIMEREYKGVKHKLMAEVEDKKTIIRNLSKQLEIHQKNFDELKDELTKARKRQIYLEETYGSSMRELELLVNNFQVEEPVSKKKKTRKGDVSKSLSQSPSAVLESLRHTLMDYKKRLDNTSDELKKMKGQTEKLTKESDSYKDMISTKDKSLEESQKNYTKAARELSRLRSDYRDLETLLARMKLDLHSTSQIRDKDKVRVQELAEELMNITMKYRAENEDKMGFLHAVYQQLLAGSVLASSTGQAFHQFTWTDMAKLVHEEISSLLKHNYTSQQRLDQLEQALSSKSEGLTCMERDYSGQIEQLTTVSRDRETAWLKQKGELEAHYNQLINDIQSRSKKSQSVADQAWEKLRMSGSLQQGLETECVELRTRLAQTQQDNAGLHIAVGLLCSALYPLYARANALAAERRLLEEELCHWQSFKTQTQMLVNTLTSELGKAKDKSKSKQSEHSRRAPLLTFRIGAIAVMAANRLKNVAGQSHKMFVTYDTISGNHGLLVCTGGVKFSQRQFTGVGLTEPAVIEVESDQTNDRSVIDWLTSADLLSTVLASVSELQDTIGQMKDSVNPVECRALSSAARSCFTRLLDRLVPYFEGVPLHPMAGLKDRHSLIRKLGRGLRKSLDSRNLEEKMSLAPFQETFSGLQQYLLELTGNLHDLEVERRELLLEQSKLRQDGEELTSCQQHLKYLEDEVQAYREQTAEDRVPLARFEGLYEELNSALAREQQAQQLLTEQSRQLDEFSTRLAANSLHGVEKENTLSEAVQGLTETKMELRRKEQSMRQLNKTIGQLGEEKRGLQDHLLDAENALRTAAKDKDILATYIKSVESALEQLRKKVASKDLNTDISMSKTLLNADFIPADIGKAGPELIACQNLVGAFVDTLTQAYAKKSAADEEVLSCQQHINTLKSELTTVLRREYDNGEDIPRLDKMDVTRVSSLENIDRTGFYPLKEDSEMSYSMSKLSSPTSKPSKQSPIRTPHYMTPMRSSRAYLRPKSGGSSIR